MWDWVNQHHPDGKCNTRGKGEVEDEDEKGQGVMRRIREGEDVMGGGGRR